MSKSYLIDLSHYPQFERELTELVHEMTLLGIETSVPDLIVKLARGLKPQEIKEYELSKK